MVHLIFPECVEGSNTKPKSNQLKQIIKNNKVKDKTEKKGCGYVHFRQQREEQRSRFQTFI